MVLSLNSTHHSRFLQFEQSQRRRLGRPRLVQYLINRRYYYGDNNEPDDVNQPLGIRYVPKVVNKHVHYLFGEYEQDVLDWTVTPYDKDDEAAQDTADDIARALYRIMRRCNADDIFMKAALDGGIYGDSVFKLRYDPAIKGASFETVLPEYYHAMWHPLDVGKTTESLVAYNLDRVSAYQMFGTVGNPRHFQPLSLLDPGFATVTEHWTPWEYNLMVDDQLVSNGPNPYAPIPRAGEPQAPAWLPFIHVPNLAMNGEYFGFGDAEPIFEIQDELNMRIADFGDIINYHAHPITLVKNYFGRVEDLRTGPDVVWDMGREGEAGYLEWSGNIPGVMDYLNLLMTVLFDTASLTGVAFGRSEQSQASGSALIVQMLPIVEVVRRKRATWGPRLRTLATNILELEAMSMTSQDFKKIYKFSPEDIGNFEILPKWAPILPRDRAAVVNENVSLLVNKARSIVTALKDLGTDDPQAERDRIIADLKEFADIQIEMMQAEAEINKDIAKFENDLQPEQPDVEDQMDLNNQAHENTMAETKAKADHAIRVERVKAQTKGVGLPNRSGGKNGSGSGGSNENP